MPYSLDTKPESHRLLGAPQTQNTQKTRCCRRPPTPLSSSGRLYLSRRVRIAVHLRSGPFSNALVMSEGNVSAGSSAACGYQVALKHWRGAGLADGVDGGARKRVERLREMRSGRKLAQLRGTLVQ